MPAAKPAGRGRLLYGAGARHVAIWRDEARLSVWDLPAPDLAVLLYQMIETGTGNARIGRIESAQNSQILELEELPANPPDTPTAALRARIRPPFAQLHEERERLETQLKTLAK